MRPAAAMLAALVLCGCASTCTADSCKTSKITLGMTEAQVRDICGCGEPSRTEGTITNGKAHLEMIYGNGSSNFVVTQGEGWAVNVGPSEIHPGKRCTDNPPTVVLDDDHVTAIKLSRSCY